MKDGGGANQKPRSWTLNSREVVYKGFYQIDKVTFEHTLFDGNWSSNVEQEIFVRGNVVGVLPYDPISDQVALVHQFRIGALNQSPDPWLTEIIAGMIDTDETPSQVAIRESYEEAGIVLEEVELISHYLASPGSSTEEVFVFYAETDLSQIGGTHGLAEENEDIEVKVVAVESALDMITKGEIKNALSIIALQWLALQRQRSRNASHRG